MRPSGFLRRILHLKPLSFGLWQRLVIGYLRHKIRNIGAEAMNQLVFCHTRILDGVMKKCGHQEIRVGFRECARDQLGDFEKVIDVRLPGFAFSFLIGVLFSGKMGSGKDGVGLVSGHFSV